MERSWLFRFSIESPLVVAPLVGSLFSIWRVSGIDHRFLLDDAYITLTFAKNLAHGHGFVYNGGPPILGTTTPLYTGLVAAVGWMLPSTPLSLIALTLSGLFLQILIWLPWFLRNDLQLSETEAAVVSLLLGVTGAVEFLGMETYLFAALLVLTFALHRRREFLASGFCSGLLFLTRGEGAIAFAILLGCSMLADLRRGRRVEAGGRRADSMLFTAGFAAPFLAWSLYAMRTFGGILPNTLAAKIAQGHSALWKTFGSELFFVSLPAWCRDIAIPGLHVIGVWPALALVGLFSIVRSKPGLRPLTLWCLFYAVGYSMLGVAYYGWYVVPIYTVLTIAAGVGLGRLATRLSILPCPRVIRVAAPIAAVTLVALSLAGKSAPPGPQAVAAKRGAAYTRLAGWIRENIDASSSVAYHEIGYLGYYTDNRIIDVVGLVQDDVASYVVNQDFVTGFWKHEPDYLVFLDTSRFLGMIVRTPPFMDVYTPVSRLPGTEPGESFIIFRRGRAGGGPSARDFGDPGRGATTRSVPSSVPRMPNSS